MSALDNISASVRSALQTNAGKAVAGVLGLAVVGLVAKNVVAANRKAAFAKEVASLSKGVVHLFSMPRVVGNTPHFAPPATKLEAFLRVHKIPYVYHPRTDVLSLSPTGTVPFIALDGQLVGESQVCIDAVKRRFGIPESEGLEPEQAAVATAVRRVIDLSFMEHRYRNTLVDNAAQMKAFMVTIAPKMGIPAIAMNFAFGQFRKSAINKLNTCGLGWLSDEEYMLEQRRDVEALINLVAAADRRGHKYLFGNKASSADCLLYGAITGARVLPKLERNGANVDLLVQTPALKAFAERFEAEYFPDLAAISPVEKGVTQRFNGAA